MKTAKDKAGAGFCCNDFSDSLQTRLCNKVRPGKVVWAVFRMGFRGMKLHLHL